VLFALLRSRAESSQHQRIPHLCIGLAVTDIAS
jgi:hypothetical protein